MLKKYLTYGFFIFLLLGARPLSRGFSEEHSLGSQRSANRYIAEASSIEFGTSVITSPIPDFSCFVNNVEIPDFKLESITRNPQGSPAQLKALAHELGETLMEINLKNSKYNPEIKKALDYEIKDLALILKVQSIADLAVYGLQEWKDVSPEFSTLSGTCRPAWQNRINFLLLELNKQMVEYKLKSSTVQERNTQRRNRIFSDVYLIAKTRSQIERLSAIRMRLARGNIRSTIDDLGHSASQGLGPFPPEDGYETYIENRALGFENLKIEKAKIEKNLLEANIVFTAPELFQPKSLIDLKPDFMGGDKSISMMEPSKLYERLDNFMHRGDLKNQDASYWKQFVEAHFVPLSSILIQELSLLSKQAIGELTDVCIEPPSNFYGNKELISMAAGEVLKSLPGVSRDDILRTYKPMCEFLTKEENINILEKDLLHNTAIAGTYIGIPALFFPMGRVLTKGIAVASEAGEAALVYRMAQIGSTKSYSFIEKTAGAAFLSDLVAQTTLNGLSIMSNRYDLEIKNLFLMKAFAKGKNATEVEVMKGQIVDQILAMGLELRAKREAVQDVVALPAASLLFAGFTRILNVVSDRSSLVAISKALKQFDAGSGAEQTLRNLYAAQKGLSTAQINLTDYNQWVAALKRSVQNQDATLQIIAETRASPLAQGLPATNLSSANNARVFSIQKNLAQQVARVETRELALAKQKYLATIQRDLKIGILKITTGDLKLLETWSDPNAIGIMTIVKNRAQRYIADGSSESLAWRKALNEELGNDSLMLCEGACSVCPANIR